MNPNILGVIGPGFLNQVPALGFRVQGPGFRIFTNEHVHEASMCVYMYI